MFNPTPTEQSDATQQFDTLQTALLSRLQQINREFGPDCLGLRYAIYTSKINGRREQLILDTNGAWSNVVGDYSNRTISVIEPTLDNLLGVLGELLGEIPANASDEQSLTEYV